LNNLTVTEFKDIRVLTTLQIAEQYDTDTDTINRNFNNNKERYTEGKHYILLQGQELKEAKTSGKFYGLSAKVNKFYLWTEKGCLLQAKSLGTDKAWETYENLVDTYFTAKDIFEGLTEEMKVLLSHDKKIKIVLEHMEKTDDRMDKLEYDIPLYGCEAKELSDHVKRKGVILMGGKSSNSYKDTGIRQEVYRDIYDQIKREFGVRDSAGKNMTYLALKRKYLAEVHEFIDVYQLGFALREKIQNTNNQVNMEIA
jgi:hypothetical protein